MLALLGPHALSIPLRGSGGARVVLAMAAGPGATSDTAPAAAEEEGRLQAEVRPRVHPFAS